MTRSAQLQVQGLRTFKRTLKAAGVSMTDLRAAHKAAAMVVVDRARPDAPHRTGKLAASIKGAGLQDEAVVRAGTAKRVPYAGPIHWGWPSRHIAARPWIWAAANDTRPAWERTYLAALEHIIDAVEGAPGP